MDFINLNTEYETLNQFSKQGVTTLNNLNSFFKTIHKYTDLYLINSKKSNDLMFNEMLKFDSKASLSKNFFDFYRNYENFTSKTKSTLSKMDKDLIEPLNLFSKHLTGKYNECLSEFKNLAYSTYESKKSLERSKHKYFDSCKLAVEQEKIVLKVLNDKEKKLASDDEIEHAHDVLIKLRTLAENNCQLYKTDLQKTNRLFEENEKKYFPIIEKMKLNEESRENFLKFHFEKFVNMLEEFSTSINELFTRAKNSLQEIKVEEDLKIVDEKLNFLYKNNERIPREEFLNYEIYRRNLEKMLSNSQLVSGTSLNLTEGNDFTPNVSSVNTSNTSNLDTSISSSSSNICEEELISSLFVSIKEKDSEIPMEQLSKLLENLQNNIPYSKLFIDKVLVHYKTNLYIEVPNYQNLHHLANILVTITNNTEIKQELFEMNFAIIFIAEKTFYKNPENVFNKVYLCKLLSKNKIYNERKFWMDLMNIKINSLIENKINHELNKREKELSRESNSIGNGNGNGNGNETPSSPRNSNKSTGIGLFSIGSRMKNLFISTKMRENQKVESSMIQADLYEQIKSSEASNVVKEYILHFSNFSFDVSEAIDIIVELSQTYNYDKEKVSYFIALLNSNLFTIKNKLLSKIHTADYKHDFMGKDYKSYFKLNDHVMTVLTYSMRFMELKEYPNMLLLNKNYCKKVSKIVYKNVLFKYHNMDMKLRLSIWKSLLNVYELKRNVNYQELLQEIEKTDQSSLIEPIVLDVQRTSFDGNNVEFKRNAILNILKAVSYKTPNVNYCQGMNYIAAFIYQMTNDEEEAFYFLYGILSSTEYGHIFLNDLVKLKQFFYVFERLLFIYLPELHIYFKNNSILVSYFISPWFITLFTNSYQYINSSTSPKILIRIWDDFLMNGWKAIIKTGLCLIKHYEHNLLQLKYEDLLHFLINDVIKYGFFQNSNYDYFINISKNVKLPSGLLSNLENEYYLESKSRESEEKRREEQKKIAYEKEHSIKI